MTSSERPVLSLQIKLHYSLVFIIMTLLLCLIIHYYVSPLLPLWMILFFNLIIKPLPLISHCLFSVFCFHGASDMIVFYFPQAAWMERTERYWKREALSSSAWHNMLDRISIQSIMSLANFLKALQWWHVLRGGGRHLQESLTQKDQFFLASP